MNYVEARAVLDELPRFEVKPGLERIGRLLERLGHPQHGLPSIHVAGTNGKGSVVAMLDSILRAAGFRVSRFTSPEIVDFRDRIAIDGEWLSEDEWAHAVERMATALSEGDDRPAQFEAVTAVAFDAFARFRVEVAVVEVGLGGRFDATNLVEPILTILTNVSLDHTGILGDSIERIAWEKAGIAKRGVPLLVGPLSPEAGKVVTACADEAGATLVDASQIDVAPLEDVGGFARYRVGAADLPDRLDLGLLGRTQLENLRLALGAVRLLRARGLEVPSTAVQEGLRSVSWPGRFEVVRRSPMVILDGAHNVAGAEALAEEMKCRVPERSRRHLILGILADKDVSGIVDALVPRFASVAVTRSSSPRALPVEELARHVDGRSIPFTCYDSVAEALGASLTDAGGDEVWVVAGSLTVVGEARRFLEGER